MVDIDIAQGNELARIRAFYETVGYGGGVTTADLVLVATRDRSLAGVVRLCQDQGVTVLRGMQVAPDCRRQGIGLALLAACGPWLGPGPAYCLPYAHLGKFYARAGFLPAAPATLPRFLADRLAAYRLAGQQVIAMRRLPAG